MKTKHLVSVGFFNLLLYALAAVGQGPAIVSDIIVNTDSDNAAEDIAGMSDEDEWITKEIFVPPVNTRVKGERYGCVDDAALNILGYWYDQGCSSLFPESTHPDFPSDAEPLMQELHENMNTDEKGWTRSWNVASGIQATLDAHDIDGSVQGHYSWSFETIQEEINRDRPCIIQGAINPYSICCRHAVCVVGYKVHKTTNERYLIILNNDGLIKDDEAWYSIDLFNPLYLCTVKLDCGEEGEEEDGEEEADDGEEEENSDDDDSDGDGSSGFDDCYAIADIEISASEPKYTEVDGTVNSCVSKIIVKNNSDKTIYCYWLVEPEGDYSIDWGGWQYAFVYSGEEQEHYNPTWGCNNIISGNPKCYSASIATAFYAVPECSWIGDLFTQYAYEPQPDDLDEMNIHYVSIKELNPCEY